MPNTSKTAVGYTRRPTVLVIPASWDDASNLTPAQQAQFRARCEQVTTAALAAYTPKQGA